MSSEYFSFVTLVGVILLAIVRSSSFSSRNSDSLFLEKLSVEFRSLILSSSSKVLCLDVLLVIAVVVEDVILLVIAVVAEDLLLEL